MNGGAADGRPAGREADDVPYQIAWKALSQRPGSHRSRHAGPGGRFRDVVPFLSAPDPRRIDLRQTLRDPWECLHVRRFEQTADIDVVVLADVSGSMGFRGHGDKMAIVAELADVLARSARRAGDRFGLIACDDHIRDDLGTPLSRARGGEQELADRLAQIRPRSAGASALVSAAQSLAGRKRLILLVSDFRLSSTDLTAVLDALVEHDVLAIVLDDSAEAAALPSWGLISLQDLETGRARSVFMRPALKERFIAEDRERRSVLLKLLMRTTRDTLFVRDKLDWHRLGAALLGAR